MTRLHLPSGEAQHKQILPALAHTSNDDLLNFSPSWRGIQSEEIHVTDFSPCDFLKETVYNWCFTRHCSCTICRRSSHEVGQIIELEIFSAIVFCHICVTFAQWGILQTHGNATPFLDCINNQHPHHSWEVQMYPLIIISCGTFSHNFMINHWIRILYC